jgi:SulP family sulfate permease
MKVRLRSFFGQGFETGGIASDLGAGITKSIDSVTGGMANALLAGVNPMYGLYTVLAATPVGALFSSSVFMNIDSTGALSAAAGTFLLVAPEADRPAALAMLTLLTGAFLPGSSRTPFCAVSSPGSA